MHPELHSDLESGPIVNFRFEIGCFLYKILQIPTRALTIKQKARMLSSFHLVQYSIHQAKRDTDVQKKYVIKNQI
jgi:hypothetical protein